MSHTPAPRPCTRMTSPDLIRCTEFIAARAATDQLPLYNDVHFSPNLNTAQLSAPLSQSSSMNHYANSAPPSDTLATNGPHLFAGALVTCALPCRDPFP